MKKIIAGGFMMLVGTFLFLTAHILAVLQMPKMDRWITSLGKYGTAVSNTGGQTSMTIATILGLIGFILLIWGSVFENLKKSSISFDQHKRYDSENK